MPSWPAVSCPDIMVIPTDNLDAMIQSGMLLNLDDYLDQMPHVQSFEGLDVALNYVRKFRSNDTGSVYCMPLNVGGKTSRYQLDDSTDRRGVKLQWEAYEKAGCPEIKDMDGLLDAAQAMWKQCLRQMMETVCMVPCSILVLMRTTGHV